MILIVILVALILLAIPVFIPTWKGFWVSSAIIGLPLIALWGQHFHVTSQPDYNGSPGDGLGIVIVGFPTLCFLLGMFIRYCMWIIRILRTQKHAKSERSK